MDVGVVVVMLMIWLQVFIIMSRREILFLFTWDHSSICLNQSVSVFLQVIWAHLRKMINGRTCAMLAYETPQRQVSLNFPTYRSGGGPSHSTRPCLMTCDVRELLFFLSVFLHWISFFIFGAAVRSGSVSAGCEVSAFRALRSMSPSVNLLSNEQTNITWRSLRTLLVPFGPRWPPPGPEWWGGREGAWRAQAAAELSISPPWLQHHHSTPSPPFPSLLPFIST